jgi:hypothetical protein
MTRKNPNPNHSLLDLYLAISKFHPPREMLNAEASSIIIVNRVIYKKGASFGVNEKKNRGTKAERVE